MYRMEWHFRTPNHIYIHMNIHFNYVISAHNTPRNCCAKLKCILSELIAYKFSQITLCRLTFQKNCLKQFAVVISNIYTNAIWKRTFYQVIFSLRAELFILLFIFYFYLLFINYTICDKISFILKFCAYCAF